MFLDQMQILNSLTLTMGQFIEDINRIQPVSLSDFNAEDTMVVMIDMINGFCKFGPLSSPHVESMIPSMSDFLDQAASLGIPLVSYRDEHPLDAKEFRDYPPHCIKDTDESQLVDELTRFEFIDIPKNSTNGFLAKNPLDTIPNGSKIKNILVIGCVTDICVRDFATTMNKYLQQINQPCRVLIVENLVDTFDIEGVHNRQVEQALSLYHMQQSGLTITRIKTRV